MVQSIDFDDLWHRSDAHIHPVIQKPVTATNRHNIFLAKQVNMSDILHQKPDHPKENVAIANQLQHMITAMSALTPADNNPLFTPIEPSLTAQQPAVASYWGN